MAKSLHFFAACLFCSPCLLCPLCVHKQLNPWQQEKLQQSTPALLSLLQQMGAAATVAEDTMTSIGASWRAGSAVVQVGTGREGSAGELNAT